MKITKTHIRLIGYTGLSAAMYALVVLLIGTVFGVQRYDLHVDGRIIPAINDELAAHVKSLPHGIRVGPDVSAQTIQKQFPWIHSLSFSRMATQTMYVAVTIDEPRIKVNEAIITDQSRVISASTYMLFGIAALPTLKINFPAITDLDEIPDSFIPHAQLFIDARFAPYTVSWIDEYSARLTDIEQPNFTILFNAHAIPDAAMFTHCSTIKQILKERGSFEGRHKGTHWIADVRFERQVIVYSEKGGIAHG